MPPNPVVRGPSALVHALSEVRSVLAGAAFPLDLDQAPAARSAAGTLLAQLEDYVIPRLGRLDAPILAVVGGSTGAGKSTLVNSLVRAPVSAAGVLRPTTRAPLIVCHPADQPWFADRALLARFTRSGAVGRRPDERSLRVVSAPALSAGVALLDAPDIDSVVADNRSLARELFAAGDVWLFVTTAVRYADAIPWQVLRDGRERGAAVAVVLDRVPAEARDDIIVHFEQMLSVEGFAGTPVFVLTESKVDSQGLLPESEVAPIKRWMAELSQYGSHGYQVIRQTLLGAVASVGPRVEALARHADDQIMTATTLATSARVAYETSYQEIDSRLRAGVVLRGEVYTQWRELVANGELRQALRSATGPARTQVNAALAERPLPGRRFAEAVAASIVTLIAEGWALAAQRCADSWTAEPAGMALLARDPSLGQPPPSHVELVHDLVARWQAWLRARSRAMAPRVRTRTRSYLTASSALLITVAAVAPPVEEITASGAEPTALRSVVDSPAVASLAGEARAQLLTMVGQVFSAEARRREAAIAATGVDVELASALRAHHAELRQAWSLFVARTGEAT